MENQIAYFQRDELAYVSRILRSAFEIRTVDNEIDEILADFLEALEEGRPICEEGNDELLGRVDARDSQ